jgi:aminoglycoside 6'-N-acetyltransferase I
MRIIDLHPGYEEIIPQVAAMLVEAFKDHWPEAWPDEESALIEVNQSFGEGRISRIAVDDNGLVLGWIGGIGMYGGRVWELHPLVVSPAAQGKGVGRALVADLEEQVAERGGLTLWLGSDDEDHLTSLGGVDLYPNPLEHLIEVKNLRNHPFGFYQKLGFVIVGVMPDANGFGKPDIYMAKRVIRR